MHGGIAIFFSENVLTFPKIRYIMTANRNTVRANLSKGKDAKLGVYRVFTSGSSGCTGDSIVQRRCLV